MRFLSLPPPFQRTLPAAEAISPPGDDLFAASFAEADVGLVHVGLDGRILRANRNFCDLLGYSEAEIVGRDKLSLVSAEAGASLARDLESLRI
jgi:PAS domain S-box-containing protein